MCFGVILFFDTSVDSNLLEEVVVVYVFDSVVAVTTECDEVECAV